MKNTVLVVLAIAVIGLAAWRFVSAKPTRFVPADTVTGYGVCLACKSESVILRQRTELAPFKCPTCDDQAVYSWLICGECGTRFIPALVHREGEPPRPTAWPECPSCHCNTVTAYDPSSGHIERKRDAALPAWPQ